MSNPETTFLMIDRPRSASAAKNSASSIRALQVGEIGDFLRGTSHGVDAVMARSLEGAIRSALRAVSDDASEPAVASAIGAAIRTLGISARVATELASHLPLYANARAAGGMPRATGERQHSHGSPATNEDPFANSHTEKNNMNKPVTMTIDQLAEKIATEKAISLDAAYEEVVAQMKDAGHQVQRPVSFAAALDEMAHAEKRSEPRTVSLSRDRAIVQRFADFNPGVTIDSHKLAEFLIRDGEFASLDDARFAADNIISRVAAEAR